MGQSKAGAAKAKQTLIDKHGGIEGYRAFMVSIAAKGGRNGVGHEFGHGSVDPRVIGKIGGKASRRKKNGKQSI